MKLKQYGNCNFKFYINKRNTSSIEFINNINDEIRINYRFIHESIKHVKVI